MEELSSSLQRILEQPHSDDIIIHAPMFIAAIVFLLIPLGLSLVSVFLSSIGHHARSSDLARGPLVERLKRPSPRAYIRPGQKLNSRVFASYWMLLLLFCMVLLLLPLAASVGIAVTDSEVGGPIRSLMFLIGGFLLVILMYVAGRGDNRHLMTFIGARRPQGRNTELDSK